MFFNAQAYTYLFIYLQKYSKINEYIFYFTYI